MVIGAGAVNPRTGWSHVEHQQHELSHLLIVISQELVLAGARQHRLKLLYGCVSEFLQPWVFEEDELHFTLVHFQLGPSANRANIYLDCQTYIIG